jgi:hypothetical protein
MPTSSMEQALCAGRCKTAASMSHVGKCAQQLPFGATQLRPEVCAQGTNHDTHQPLACGFNVRGAAHVRLRTQTVLPQQRQEFAPLCSGKHKWGGQLL